MLNANIIILLLNIIYKNNDKKNSKTILVLQELDLGIECILLGTNHIIIQNNNQKEIINLKLLRFQASKKKEIIERFNILFINIGIIEIKTFKI